MKFYTVLALGLPCLLGAQEVSPVPAECSTSTSATFPKNAKLPDPYLLGDGKRLSTKDAWACKRAEIRSQIQKYELGTKPPKPTVSATVSGNSSMHYARIALSNCHCCAWS